MPLLAQARPTMQRILLICVNKMIGGLYYIILKNFKSTVRAYSVYAFCPICARCNISTLHIGFVYYCLLKRQKTRKAEQWESTQQGFENGEGREALLARPRLIIDDVLRDSVTSGECSVSLSVQSDQLVRIRITEACVTRSNMSIS